MRETIVNSNIINKLYDLKNEPTLYQQLSPLGFAEWLEKNFQWLIEIKLWIEDHDKEPIGSVERTQLNALAFRWMREEKDLSCRIDFKRPNEWYYKIDSIKENKCLYGSVDDYLFYDTHPLAEHEALNKALEILSKGGENGN